MKYLDRRDQIKSGDILGWTHREFKTWYDFKVQMVRMFTRSEYAHVGIAWVYGGRIFVIESVIPYVRIVPLSNLLPVYVVHVNADLKEERALELVGKGVYSQWEAIKAYFGKNKDPNLWECAELVQEVSTINFNCKAVPSDIIAAAQALGSMEYLEP